MYGEAEEHVQRLATHHADAHTNAQHSERRGSRPTSASASTRSSAPAPGARTRLILGGSGTRPGAEAAESPGEQQQQQLQQGPPPRRRSAKPSRSLGEGSLGSLVARTLRQLSFSHRKGVSTLSQSQPQRNHRQQQQHGNPVGAVEGPAQGQGKHSSLDRPSKGQGQGGGSGHGSPPGSPVPNGWKAGALPDGRSGSRTAASRQHSSYTHPYQQHHQQPLLLQQHRQVAEIAGGEDAGPGSFGGPSSLGRDGHMSTLLGHWANGSRGPTGAGTGSLSSTSHTHVTTPTARALSHPHGPASHGPTSAFHRAAGSVEHAAAAAATTTNRTQAHWAALGAGRTADHHDPFDTAALLNTLDTQHDPALTNLLDPHGDPQPSHVPLPGPHHSAPNPQPHSRTRSANPHHPLQHHTSVPIGGGHTSSARNRAFLHDANDPLATSTWALMAERSSWQCLRPGTEPAAARVGPGAGARMRGPRPGMRMTEVFGLDTEDKYDQSVAVGMVRRCGSATAVEGSVSGRLLVGGEGQGGEGGEAGGAGGGGSGCGKAAPAQAHQVQRVVLLWAERGGGEGGGAAGRSAAREAGGRAAE